MRALSILLVLALATSPATADPVVEIESMLAAWHHASATADADTYFGLMTEDCIFLGTDATERWTRDELREWAAFAFERDVAWAFTVTGRSVYLHDDGRLGWFEEYLETNMGPCRASGVVVLTDDGWRVRHYDLALTIPNERLDAVKSVLRDE